MDKGAGNGNVEDERTIEEDHLKEKRRHVVEERTLRETALRCFIPLKIRQGENQHRAKPAGEKITKILSTKLNRKIAKEKKRLYGSAGAVNL